MRPAQRIGLFGGAFDPPHDAHLALVRAALDALSLGRLHVVPTGDAWHKSRVLSPANDRLAMCRLAFAGCPQVFVDDRELQRTGPTYTIDTLTELRAEYPVASLFLLIGADQAQAFSTWRRAQDIVALASVVIAERASVAAPLDAGNPLPGLDLANAQAPRRLPLAALSHSSSAIRTRVRSGQSIDGLVPAAVARYIAEHQLYQSLH